MSPGSPAGSLVVYEVAKFHIKGVTPHEVSPNDIQVSIVQALGLSDKKSLGQHLGCPSDERNII